MRGRRVLAILHNAQPCSAMALAQRSAITQIASRGQAGGARHRSTTAYEIDPSRVTITQGADGVAEVRLSRPDKMNALDLPMFRSIAAAARRLLADRSVRAVALQHCSTQSNGLKREKVRTGSVLRSNPPTQRSSCAAC